MDIDSRNVTAPLARDWAAYATDVLGRLLYPRERTWLPVPAWCHFYIELGAAIARQPATTGRIVVGVASPTRAFAAPFTSLGLILATVFEQSRPQGFQAHFDHLASLPIGTPVTVSTPAGDRRTRGKLCGQVVRSGQPMLQVEVSARRDLHLLPPQEALRVQLAAAEEIALPSRPVLRPVRARARFALSLLPDESHDVIGRSALDCVVVGMRTDLEHELTRARFGVFRDRGAPIPGTLQDVVRVRDFTHGGDTYRSDFVPATGKQRPPAPGAAAPVAAVFDGASSYLRRRHFWPSAHAIVLLDRTAAQFDVAVQQLNQDSARANMGSVPLPVLPVPPSGVELLIFRERFQ